MFRGKHVRRLLILSTVAIVTVIAADTLAVRSAPSPAGAARSHRRARVRVRVGPCPSSERSQHRPEVDRAARRRRHRRPVCPAITRHPYHARIDSPQHALIRPGGSIKRPGGPDEPNDLNPEFEQTDLPHGSFRAVRSRGVPTEPSAPAPVASQAGPNGPVQVFKNIDPGDNLWETSGGSDGPYVFMTGNWGADFSADAGKTWTQVSPSNFVSDIPGGFCCDQVALYAPGINRFIWVVQTAQDTSGNNVYRLAEASPSQLARSAGRSWTSWDFRVSDFGIKNAWMDYPDLALSNSYLLMTFNAVGSGGSVGMRIPLDELARGGSIGYAWFFQPGQLRPAQASGAQALFAAQQSDNKLAVYSWDEGSNNIRTSKLDIPTIPTTNWQITTPDGTTELTPLTKINSGVQTGTRASGKVYFAWSAARDSTGHPNDWPQPHVEIAVVDAGTLVLDHMDYLWSSTHAWVWPSLTTNKDGDVGVTAVWGGGDQYLQSVVGMLTDPRTFAEVTSGKNRSGGHYVTIRPHFPLDTCFSAFVNGQRPIGVINHPAWVLLGRRGATCDHVSPVGPPQIGPPVPVPPPSPVGPPQIGPPKSPSSLTLTCPADPGGVLNPVNTVHGGLSPSLGDEPVTITYTPDRTYPPITDPVTTDATGAFVDTVTLGVDAHWTMQASWPGDITHTGASSAICGSFTVVSP
jgi:hypothetical protein